MDFNITDTSCSVLFELFVNFIGELTVMSCAFSYGVANLYHIQPSSI
jgi:hypothetical protein